jgi:multidrug efflux pump subunit AcrB
MTRKQRNFLLILLALLAVPALLIGLVVYLSRNRSSGQHPPSLVITVEAGYPGANAQVVADTVAEPIEQQVNGVEGMRYVRSFSGKGSYVLEVHFPPGTDLDIAQVLVQNRVALAQPVLPATVTDRGIKVVKQSPSAFALVAIFSPDRTRDPFYLGRYASRQVRDELARLPGVGDVFCPGQRGSWRVWPKADPLAAHGLLASDVAAALRASGAVVEPLADHLGATADGGPWAVQWPDTSVRLLGELRVRSDPGGPSVRLDEVARVEAADRGEALALLDDSPAVLLALYPTGKVAGRQLSSTLRERMADLGDRFPPGIEYSILFDSPQTRSGRAGAAHLVVDLTFPEGASPARRQEILQQCVAVVRKAPGVQHVLATTEHPFARPRQRPCLVVELDAAVGGRAERERIVIGLRSELSLRADAVCTVGDLSAWPGDGYGLHFVVHGPQASEVRQLATKLAERLRDNPNLTDVSASPAARAEPQVLVDIDRARCQALEVGVDDVYRTLRDFVGGLRPGPPGARVVVVEHPGIWSPEDLGRLLVRSATGNGFRCLP